VAEAPKARAPPVSELDESLLGWLEGDGEAEPEEGVDEPEGEEALLSPPDSEGVPGPGDEPPPELPLTSRGM